MAEATLDPRLISETVNRLPERIHARFPESGLSGVALKLCRVAERANATSDWIARPIWPLRLLVLFLAGIIILGLILTLWTLPLPAGGLELAQFIHRPGAAPSLNTQARDLAPSSPTSSRESRGSHRDGAARASGS